MEADTTMVCRKADEKLVNDLKDDVAKAFSDKAGFQVDLKVLPELSENS